MFHRFFVRLPEGTYVHQPFAKDVTGKPGGTVPQLLCRAWRKVQGADALKTDALGRIRMDSHQFPPIPYKVVPQFVS